MKKLFTLRSLLVILFLCFNSLACKNNSTFQTTVLRQELTVLPDYYMFAFQNPTKCGIDFLSLENVNKIIMEDGGTEFANAFCCYTDNEYRIFTARHTFVNCAENPDLKVENFDVASLPFNAISGFQITKPVNGSIVTIKGFRVTDNGVEWLEIRGQMNLGTLSDLSAELSYKPTWNPGNVWLIKADNTGLAYDNLKGLSGAPVFNSKGQVVACFSGFYPIKNGKALSDGTYLRLEALQK